MHFFDDSYRPVPLEVHTIAYGNPRNIFLFERSLDDRVPEVIRKYSQGRQTLIFCSSKKGTETLASLLASKLGTMRQNAAAGSQQSPFTGAAIQDQRLHGLVNQGFAYHHAGLPPDDRMAIEDAFLMGHIMVLCSTSTLVGK